MWTHRSHRLVAAFTVTTAVAVEVVMAGADPLAGSGWRPTEIVGEGLPADNDLFIRFEANDKIAGHGGCNSFFGKYQIDAVNLTIGPLGSTRKACPPVIMKREAAFLGALQKARLFLRDGVKLTLKDGQGVTVLRLAQNDGD